MNTQIVKLLKILLNFRRGSNNNIWCQNFLITTVISRLVLHAILKIFMLKKLLSFGIFCKMLLKNPLSIACNTKRVITVFHYDKPKKQNIKF